MGVLFCLWQAVVQIVSALDAAGAGDFPFKMFDEGTGFLHQLDGAGFGDFVPCDEVKSGAAAHRTDVEDVVRIGGIAHIGGKQMLEGVDAVIFQGVTMRTS